MTDFEQLQQAAQAAGLVCVVGGLIRNAEGRIFAQKRTLDRRLFPGCWDIVGGHVEAGETLTQALAREIEEETGWRLTEVGTLIKLFDWESGGVRRREFDFLVEVDGDLNAPQLETEKFATYDWFGPDNVARLKEHRQPGDYVIYEMVCAALDA
jgi:8-oxo-dGTP pyrophosphatase MutT (NUDIX family)